MTWARATLRRGASAGSVWQVDSSYPQARVVIGSAAGAGWVVTDPSVAPYHVELYWDGNALYVSDPQACGDVRLDGRVIHGWTQVQGRGVVTFGQAVLEIETATRESTALVNDPSAAPRVSLVGEPTRMHEPGLGPPSVTRELEAESTRIAEPFEEVPEIPGSKAVITSRPQAPPGRSATRSSAGFSASAPQSVPPPRLGPVERPHLGGASAGGRKPARTLIDNGPTAAAGVEPPTLAEAPPFASSPTGLGVEPPRIGSSALAPAAGASTRAMLGEPPSQPGGLAVSVLGGAVSPAFGGSPQPSISGEARSVTGPSFAGAGVGAAPPRTGGFVPPPAFTEESKPAQGAKAVPTRTRLLLALFGAVVLAWLAMPTPEEEEQAQRAALAARAPVASADAGVRERPRYVNPSTFVPVLSTVTVDGGLPRTPEAVAAQLVADGRLEDALVQYEALLEAHPDRPEFRAMREILLRRLMNRCVDGMRWDRTPCFGR